MFLKKPYTSVTDHVLYMIDMIERLGKFSFSLHEQLRKDAILNSLLDSYLDFFSHFRMTKPTLNYHGLLGLLQTYKKDHQLQNSSMNLVKSFGAGLRPFKKGMKKKNKNKRVQNAGPNQAKKKKAYKNQAKYFFCITPSEFFLLKYIILDV